MVGVGAPAIHAHRPGSPDPSKVVWPVYVDPVAWMPPAMDEARKKAYADAYPDDPHAAAAAAWEEWAALMSADPTIKTAGTGAQSVTFVEGKSAFKQAESRARWHRTRAKPYSVPVYSMGTPASTMLDGS